MSYHSIDSFHPSILSNLLVIKKPNITENFNPSFITENINSIKIYQFLTTYVAHYDYILERQQREHLPLWTEPKFELANAKILKCDNNNNDVKLFNFIYNLISLYSIRSIVMRAFLFGTEIKKNCVR